MTKDEALKLALEALESCGGYPEKDFDLIKVETALAAINEALAQPESEPVVFNTLASLKHKKTVGPIERAMLNTTPPKPEQEPVAHRDGYWCNDLTCKKCYSADFRFKHKNSVDKESLTTQSQRPWVGLTAQEAADCWATSASKTWHNLEAKLKEKNS